MKWNKRLKTVLTTPAKSGFSADCLETELRITAETPKSLVSAVIRSGHSRHYSKNNDKLAELKTDYFHTELNRFIENGVAFDVSDDDFQVIDNNQKLKLSDKQFLELNNAAILCHLQQSLLVKHLFNHSPEQFEDFAFEITERECLKTPLRITDKTPFEIYLEAVKSTTRKWFADLLEKREG